MKKEIAEKSGMKRTTAEEPGKPENHHAIHIAWLTTKAERCGRPICWLRIGLRRSCSISTSSAFVRFTSRSWTILSARSGSLPPHTANETSSKLTPWRTIASPSSYLSMCSMKCRGISVQWIRELTWWVMW